MAVNIKIESEDGTSFLLERKDQVKYLGVHLDDTVSFKHYTSYVASRIFNGIIAKLWHKGLLPVLFQNYFQYSSSIHGYNTRYASKQNLYKPKERTNSGKQAVAFAACVLWDDIPVDLKNLNACKFSKKLKHYLLSEQHSETLS